MGLRRHLQKHQGAGILFVRWREGRWEALFCQRRKSGQWSLPGGLREPGETFLACALREAHEEVGSPLKGLQGKRPARVFCARLPLLFCWDTYLWPLDGDGPDFPADWPTTHAPEFRTVAWHPLDSPPTPLYFLMPLTLAGARKQLPKAPDGR